MNNSSYPKVMGGMKKKCRKKNGKKRNKEEVRDERYRRGKLRKETI
jgi:hypothetical protein